MPGFTHPRPSLRSGPFSPVMRRPAASGDSMPCYFLAARAVFTPQGSCLMKCLRRASPLHLPGGFPAPFKPRLCSAPGGAFLACQGLSYNVLTNGTNMVGNKTP